MKRINCLRRCRPLRSTISLHSLFSLRGWRNSFFLNQFPAGVSRIELMERIDCGKALIVSRHCVITHHSPMNCLAIRSWRSNVYNYCYNNFAFTFFHSIQRNEWSEIKWSKEWNDCWIDETNSFQLSGVGYNCRYFFFVSSIINGLFKSKQLNGLISEVREANGKGEINPIQCIAPHHLLQKKVKIKFNWKARSANAAASATIKLIWNSGSEWNLLMNHEMMKK